MHVETIIYAYLAICVSMILFNCVYIFVYRKWSDTLARRSLQLEKVLQEEMKRAGQGEGVSPQHKAFLMKKLRNVRHLLAFDEALEAAVEKEPEQTEGYMKEIHPVFVSLAIENPYRSEIKMTYFAYVVGKYKILKGRPVDVVMDFLMRLLRQPSLYCRENALQAIYSAGDCDCVLKALKAVDENGRFHHGKLLTDGMLTFEGDMEQLADVLFRNFDDFSEQMKVVILDFIRFSGCRMDEKMLQLMADDRQDDEVRFSCIRYFGKHVYKPAWPLLLGFAGNRKDARWEYAAIAASALAVYPKQRTIDVLKDCLHHSNWYVRFNAAQSLERLGLTYRELSDVFDGNDRYAREILQYQMDMRKAREKREVME